MNTSRN